MSSTPSRTIEQDFIEDLTCPICGQDELHVHPMERFPDYVACGNCESQFVLEEDGERVMYGKIPAAYPRTRRFALQQWAWPEAVARRATEERPAVSDLPPSASVPPPQVEEPPPEPQEVGPPPTEIGESSAEPLEAESDVGADLVEEGAPDLSAEEVEPSESEVPSPADIFDGPATEPPADDETAEPPSPDLGEVPADPDSSWMSEAEPMEMESSGSAPPFGEGPPGPEIDDELPSEAEPAPDMPDWLQSAPSESIESPTADTEEPSAGPTAFGEEPPGEQDLTASLWDESAPSAEAPAESMEGPDWMQGSPSEPEEELAAAGEEDDFASLFDSEAEGIPDFGSAESEADWPGATSGGDARDFGAEADEELSESEVAEMLWTGQVGGPGQQESGAVAAGAGAAAIEEIAKGEGGEREPEEPPPGTRHRVVLQGGEARFPKELCAHCGRTPVAGSLAVTATVYLGTGLGERKVKSYRIPVCSDCRQRATARSEEQQTARIQAHLVSVLVGLVMVIGGLAFRLVDFQGAVLLDLAVLLLLGGMGYLMPAVLLLLRASRHAKPADAEFVETTLRVPADTEGIETAFEWRNPTYAQLFLNANQEIAASKVSKIRERSYEG